MRTVKFRLESVQKLRETRETEALRALAVAQRALQTELEKKEQIKRDTDNARLRLSDLGRDATRIAEFHVEQTFIDGSLIRIRHVDVLIRRAERSVEKAMAVYQVARKNRKMIDVLRDRAYQEYLEARRKLEQRETDDMTSMRFNRIENNFETEKDFTEDYSTGTDAPPAPVAAVTASSEGRFSW